MMLILAGNSAAFVLITITAPCFLDDRGFIPSSLRACHGMYTCRDEFVAATLQVGLQKAHKLFFH